MSIFKHWYDYETSQHRWPSSEFSLDCHGAAIGFTFKIIEALSTATDNMTWMVNSKTWHAGGLPSIRKENILFAILSDRIDQKQITVPENK